MQGEDSAKIFSSFPPSSDVLELALVPKRFCSPARMQCQTRSRMIGPPMSHPSGKDGRSGYQSRASAARKKEIWRSTLYVRSGFIVSLSGSGLGSGTQRVGAEWPRTWTFDPSAGLQNDRSRIFQNVRRHGGHLGARPFGPSSLHRRGAFESPYKRPTSNYPPAMPSMTFPVPSQFGHRLPSTLPLPLQFGQRFSPVPGVPAGASSPGLLMFGSVDICSAPWCRV